MAFLHLEPGRALFLVHAGMAVSLFLGGRLAEKKV